MNELNDKKLYKNLRKKVKKALGIGFMSKATEEQKLILLDLKFVTVGMADFLLLDDFNSKDEYLESIKAFLSLEEKAYDYGADLVYEIGKMELVGGRIRLRHQLNDFEAKYSLKNLRQKIKPNE